MLTRTGPRGSAVVLLMTGLLATSGGPVPAPTISVAGVVDDAVVDVGADRAARAPAGPVVGRPRPRPPVTAPDVPVPPPTSATDTPAPAPTVPPTPTVTATSPPVAPATPAPPTPVASSTIAVATTPPAVASSPTGTPPPAAPTPAPTPTPEPDPGATVASATAAPDAWRTVHASLRTRTVTLPGPVVVHELQWRLGDPALRVRTDTAVSNGGRATVLGAAAARGAVAAVNGGYWLDADDPDGWLVTDGRLRSDTTGGRFWKRNLRGGFGLSEGRAVVGVPTWDARVSVGGESRTVRGVARRPIGQGDVVLFPHGTWTHPPVPAGGRFLRVPAPDRLDATGRHVLPVLQSATTPPRLDDPATMIVWFDEQAAAGIAGDATEVVLDITSAEAWSGLDQGLVAGPWVIGNGASTGVGQWRSEGFTAAHTDRRHPRSAIGLTADGHAMVSVVDGRQAGWSIGMTVAELTEHLLGRGMVDAVLLDGGGSSQLAVAGQLVNRPCCDAPVRPVATVLLFEPR